MAKRKTDQEVLDQANRLARDLHRLSGYVVPKDFRFDQTTHPRHRRAWEMARVAMLELTATDPNDAVDNLSEETEDDAGTQHRCRAFRS